MAKKRLNVPFLVVLIIIMAVCTGLGYGFWKLNRGRIADSFYEVGNKAYDSGDMVTAMDNYRKFLASSNNAKKRGEIFQKMALYQAMDIDKIGVGSPEKLEAVQKIMQQALEADPNNKILKEAMAKAYIRMRKYTQAARLLKELSMEDTTNPDYVLELANCYLYAEQAAEANTMFSRLVEEFPTFIQGFLSYANYYETNLGQPNTAEEILNTMVEMNPKVAKAYSIRAIFRLDHQNSDGAEEDVKMALELDPASVDTNIAAAVYAIYSKDFVKAHTYLEDALKADPERIDEVNRLKIRLADEEKKPDEAIDLVRAEAERKNDLAIRLQLFERLVSANRLDDAKKEIEYLRRVRLPSEIVGFFEATIDILEGRWKEAMRKLEMARGALSMHTGMLAFIDRQLAQCYGELGQKDKQLDAFARAIENASEQELLPFYTAYILVLNEEGRTERLEEVVRELIVRIGEKKFSENPQLRAIRAALMTQREVSAANTQESLDSINAMLEEDAEFEADPEVILLGVRMLIKQEKTDIARKLLAKAIKKSPETLAFPSYYALLEAQERNYDKALAILDEASQGKQIPGLMLAKIRILLQMGQDTEETEEPVAEETPAKPTEQPTATFDPTKNVPDAPEGEAAQELPTLETAEAQAVGEQMLAESQAKTGEFPYLAKAKDELTKLEKESEKLEKESRAPVLRQLALAWMNLDELPNAQRIFNELIKDNPDNLGLKVQLFDIARKADDEAQMDAQLNGVQEVFGTDSPEALYCRAAKVIWQFNKKKATKLELNQAREYLNRARTTRPNWVNLPRALAEIAILSDDYNQAIEQLYRVDQLGAMSTQQLNLLIRLLFREGRDIEVKQLIENKKGAQLASDVAMISVETLMNAGESDEAIRRAREIAAKDPSSQLWKGHVALRSRNFKEAENIFRMVTEQAPENPQGWLSLLQVLKIENIGVNKEEFIRNIQDNVEQKKKLLCMARAYQLFGDVRNAVMMFRQAVAADPTNIDVLYAISQFYMSTSQPELAIPYLKKMNELIATDKKLTPEVRNLQLVWTRRSLAQVYGKTHDYDKQQMAILLIDENLRVYPDSMEDLKIKAILLSERGNPTDNNAAIEILENIPSLGANERFILAKLYETQSASYDDQLLWDKCRMIMRDLINTSNNKREYLETFIDMLLRQKADIGEITQYFDRLKTLATGSVSTRLLNARVLIMAGKDEDAKKVLSNLASTVVTRMNEAQMKEVAAFTERVELKASTGQIWDNLIRYNARNTTGKIRFLARTEGITPALDAVHRGILNLKKNEVLDIIPVIFQLSEKPGTPDEITRAEQIAQSVVKPKDDPFEYQFFIGQFLESQNEVEKALQKYDELLKSPTLTKIQKAYVQNNIANLLALSGTDVARARKLIDEAIYATGSADLRDTRAVICLRSSDPNEINQAITDLQHALVAHPNALYYFHLASAYMKKDNRNSARIAFNLAKKMDPHLAKDIMKLERADYEAIAEPLSK